MWRRRQRDHSEGAVQVLARIIYNETAWPPGDDRQARWQSDRVARQMLSELRRAGYDLLGPDGQFEGVAGHADGRSG